MFLVSVVLRYRLTLIKLFAAHNHRIHSEQYSLLSVVHSTHICLTPSNDPNENYFDFEVSTTVTLYILGAMKCPSTVASYLRSRPSRKSTKGHGFAVRVIEKTILNLNDQLLLTELTVLVTGCWTYCSISAYYFALSSDLADPLQEYT